jgi:3-dehydroquinate synthase
MEKVAVELGLRSYPILIGPDCLNQVRDHADLTTLFHYKQIAVITNPTVAALYLPALQDMFAPVPLQVLTLPDGEAYKTLASFEQACSFLLQHKFPRDGLLIALGGGVIGDMTGFVAACYQRGIEFLQVPTTLLSQVDSSVGGKTAVNHPLGKNMIGAFKQPLAVLIDTRVLSSLPPREFAAGMAEVIKYGLLGDAGFLQWLRQQQQSISRQAEPALSQMIRHCCQMKADIVARDETEQGDRALLNLGHTFGHAIEAWLGYGTWLHGEAVAVGMVMAARLSVARGWLTPAELTQITALISAFGLPVAPPAGMQIVDFLPYMKTDKKVKNGQMRFVLLQRPGHAVIVSDVTEQELLQVFGASND